MHSQKPSDYRNKNDGKKKNIKADGFTFALRVKGWAEVVLPGGVGRRHMVL